MTTDSPIEIVPVEPWMIPGMTGLHLLQYGGEWREVEAWFVHRFNSETLRRLGAIDLVGLLDKRVVATLTFTPWPYRKGDQVYRSFQAGGTLVHPKFRGRNLFQRMLAEGNRIAVVKREDFFLGFPVQKSYRGFIWDKWSDLGQLRWWTRPIRPVELIRQRRQKQVPLHSLEIGEPLRVNYLFSGMLNTSDRFQLVAECEFLEWRYSNERAVQYRYFRYTRMAKQASFVLKLNGSHGFREVLVGQIRGHNSDSFFLASALRALCQEVQRDPHIAALSLAILSPSSPTCAALAMAGFIPHKLTAPLIIKPHKDIPGLLDNDLWRETCLEDMDTW